MSKFGILAASFLTYRAEKQIHSKTGVKPYTSDCLSVSNDRHSSATNQFQSLRVINVVPRIANASRVTENPKSVVCSFG